MKAVADEGRWLATPPGTEERFLTDRFARAIEDDHPLFVVAEGAASRLPRAPPGRRSRGRARPGHVAAPGPVRGRGRGRRLVEEAVAEAGRRGAHKVQLDVYPDNHRAVALYAATGFEVEGVRRDHYRRRTAGCGA